MINTVLVAALLGAMLVSGVFFAFSAFVMRALARIPPADGIAAMQSINVVVLNPAFLGVFLGTAALSLMLVAAALAGGLPWGAALGGPVVYLLGTFAVTLFGNVPLNDELARADADDPAAEVVWSRYLARWTRLNHVRTGCAAIAAALYLQALLQMLGS